MLKQSKSMHEDADTDTDRQTERQTERQTDTCTHQYKYKHTFPADDCASMNTLVWWRRPSKAVLLAEPANLKPTTRHAPATTLWEIWLRRRKCCWPRRSWRRQAGTWLSTHDNDGSTDCHRTRPRPSVRSKAWNGGSSASLAGRCGRLSQPATAVLPDLRNIKAIARIAPGPVTWVLTKSPEIFNWLVGGKDGRSPDSTSPPTMHR